MLKIKLARFGKKKQPHYRVVVNEARDKRDGSYVALLGQYAPTQVPKTLKVDLEAYKMWLTKGAQPTETVAALIKRLESGNPFPERKPSLSKKAKAKAAAAKEAANQPAPVVEETPVEVAPEVVAEKTVAEPEAVAIEEAPAA
jgi:small subunit ribosomal protein S16